MPVDGMVEGPFVRWHAFLFARVNLKIVFRQLFVIFCIRTGPGEGGVMDYTNWVGAECCRIGRAVGGDE